MFLFFCFFFFLYLVACAMVNVYKGIGKENCALLFVCFCIFSVINCRMCQLSMCACVCVRELFSLPLFVLYIVFLEMCRRSLWPGLWLGRADESPVWPLKNNSPLLIVSLLFLLFSTFFVFFLHFFFYWWVLPWLIPSSAHKNDWKLKWFIEQLAVKVNQVAQL